MSNTFKAIVVGAFLGTILAGCTESARYDGVASTCQSYAVALNTAAVLNKNGNLSTETQAKIDATIPVAKAVCSGAAPTTDQASIQKLAEAVIAVLGEVK